MQRILKRLAWLALGWSLVLANTRRQKDQPSLFELAGREGQNQTGAEADSTTLQQLEKQLQWQLAQEGEGFLTKENIEDLIPNEIEQKIKEIRKTEITNNEDTQEKQTSTEQEQDAKRNESLAETSRRGTSTQHKHNIEENRKSSDRNTTTVEEGQGAVGQNGTEKKNREDSAKPSVNNTNMRKKMKQERLKMMRESTDMGYDYTKPSYQMEYLDMMFKVSPPTNAIDRIREKNGRKEGKAKSKSGKKDKAKMMDRIKMNNETENTNTTRVKDKKGKKNKQETKMMDRIKMNNETENTNITRVKDKKQKKNKQETKLTDSEGNPLATEDKTTLKDKLKKKNKKNKNAENGETADQTGTKGKSKKEKGKGKKKRKDKSKKKNEQPTSITASVSEMTTSSSAV